MKLRFYFLFSFYALLFLFYPGNTHYLDIFAYNRHLFEDKPKSLSVQIHPVPYLRSLSYPYVTAEGVYVVERSSFTPVFERRAKERFFPASTTKLLSGLVAYDLYKPDDVVTVTNLKTEGHTMGLVEGERITAENLLYGMLVYSGNDAAYALAQAKGYDNFIRRMNKKAAEIKMTQSRFSNPAGLDDFGHYSTPFDLALVAREFLKNNYLSKFVSIKEITVADVDFKHFHKLANINELLGEIPGLGGLKTGYTENAGENLVSFYKDPQGHEYIIVILKSEDRFRDTTNIIDWLKTNIDYSSVKNSSDTAGT